MPQLMSCKTLLRMGLVALQGSVIILGSVVYSGEYAVVRCMSLVPRLDIPYSALLVARQRGRRHSFILSSSFSKSKRLLSCSISFEELFGMTFVLIAVMTPVLIASTE